MSDSSPDRPTSGDPAVGGDGRPRVRHRPAWIAFVVVGAAVCLAMGYWQLSRYRSATGTVQNLGYTFMWPVLAGFLVYGYLQYVRLEAREGPTDAPPGAGADTATDPATPRRAPRRGPHRAAPVTEIPADILPTRSPAPRPDDDEGLRQYNAYLAELARRDDPAHHGPQEDTTP